MPSRPVRECLFSTDVLGYSLCLFTWQAVHTGVWPPVVEKAQFCIHTDREMASSETVLLTVDQDDQLSEAMA